uniref:Oncostatin M n=5 Tax=Hominidae TaxID=9604 RepID=B5MC70_HUMAN
MGVLLTQRTLLNTYPRPGCS